MTMRVLSLGTVLAAVAACGGNSSNKVDGSYRGQSIDVTDAVLLPPQATTNGGAISVVVLESAADACILTQTRTLNNTRLVTVALGIVGAGGVLSSARQTGTYQIGGPTFTAAGTNLAAVRFGVIGGCGLGTTADATSGSVKVDRVSTNADGSLAQLEGTFDAVFDTGEKMSGSFDVSTCASARLIFAVCG
jgi:hypothetical protein